MKTANRFTAAFLAAALAAAAPGLTPYRAYAQLRAAPVPGAFGAPGAVPVALPLPGAPAAAAPAPLALPGLEALPALPQSGLGLTPEGTLSIRLEEAESRIRERTTSLGRLAEPPHRGLRLESREVRGPGALRASVPLWSGHGGRSGSARLSEAGRLVSRLSRSAPAAADSARAAADGVFAALTGERLAQGTAVAAPSAAPLGSLRAAPGSASRVLLAPRAGLTAEAETGPRGAGKAVLGAGLALLRMAAAAGAVVGLHLAASQLPLFGFMPAPSLWAVSFGAVLGPVALWARWRLSKTASYRASRGPRWLGDAAIGGAAGGTLVALSQLVPGLDVLFAASGAGVVSLAPLLALGLLASSMTVALYLPFITAAIRGSGVRGMRSFNDLRLPGMSPMLTRFLLIGSGAVFGLLSGMSAPSMYVNVAFAAWMFLGGTRVFSLAWLGALGYAAFTGWTSPLALLVMAFFPERMAVWTTKLLDKLLPTDRLLLRDPAPGDSADPVGSLGDRLRSADEAVQKRFPNFHYRLKTGLLFGVLTAFFAGTGVLLFGIKTLGINLAIAGAISLATFFFSDWLVVKAMRGVELTERDAPGLFRIVRGLVADSGSGMPMPRVYLVNMGVPNAFATGRSPRRAVVGVTPEILQLLDERELRGVLAHELSHVLNRDMLSSTVAGSLASAIAFAAYSILWSVSTLRNGLRRAWQGLRDARSRPQDRVRRDGGGAERGAGPQAFDPLTGGIVLTQLSGLLRLFAVLWAPIIATVVQLAITRTREHAADYDGGRLNKDPLALASALSKLANWRPGRSFIFNWLRTPFLMATGHMFTVNPLEQLETVRPRPGAGARLLLGDDALFRVFVTHPPTAQRIERLRRLAEAMPEAPKE